MKRGVLVIAGLLALAVGLVVQMPARVVADWAESGMPGLTLSGVSGTALDGRVARLLYKDLPLQNIDWQARPWSLLLGRAGADIRIATDTGGLEAAVSRSLFGGHLTASDVSGSASLGWLAQRAGYTFIPVSGRLGLELDTLTLNADGRVQSADGRIRADGLRWELINPPAPLGRLGAAINAESGTFTANIDESDGPLAVEGNARLQANGVYRLDVRLRARTEAEPRLKKLLGELGDTDADGWYHIRERGRL